MFDRGKIIFLKLLLNLDINPLFYNSRADAPILGHLQEFMLYHDMTLGYDKTGNCMDRNGEETPAELPPKPTKLRWDFNEEAKEAFTKSLEVRH